MSLTRREFLNVLAIASANGLLLAPVFGWLADRSGHAIAVLILTSIAAAAGCMISVFISTAWPTPVLGLFYALFGVVAYGWNGVMHAQIARLSPPGMVSVATGGVMEDSMPQ